MKDFFYNIGYIGAGIFIVSKTLDDLIYIYGRFFGWGDCVMVGGCGTAISEIFHSILGIIGFLYLVQTSVNKHKKTTEGDRSE